ncbi:MAG: cysteine hydrolase [Pseudonocardiales bacterium]|nr:cysteine hydrolase [Pseudonocardiales bacterium]
MSRSVLIVTDMQNGFVSSKSAQVVPRVIGLVRRWEQAGAPTVFTRFINHPGSPFERLINWTRMQSSPETDLVAELVEAAERAVAVIDKPIYSLFTPDGSTLIEKHGWTDLVLCGIATESCVLKTACDAFERGLTPWIVTDACYSHAGQEPHDAGLLVARRFVGRSQLVDSDELFRRDS